MSDYPTKFSKLGILPTRKWSDIARDNTPAVYTLEEARLQYWLAENFGASSAATKEIMQKIERKEITVSFGYKLAATYR